VSETRWSVATLVEHRRIAIDANVLIYLLENAEPHASLAAAIVDGIEGHGLRASMATIGQVEILAGPARVGDATVFERTVEEISGIGLDFVPLTTAVAEDAAWLRGQGRLQLADAIHVATARVTGATAFITNDHGIQSLPGLTVLYLDDLEVDEPVP
jgi:predicted nucleic acid-binding protein